LFDLGQFYLCRVVFKNLDLKLVISGLDLLFILLELELKTLDLLFIGFGESRELVLVLLFFKLELELKLFVVMLKGVVL